MMNNDITVPPRGKRDKLMDVLGMALAFGIAFGGLFLVRKLLMEEEKTLLRSSGMVEIVVQTPAEDIQISGEETEPGILTAEELARIVGMLEEGAEAYPHEPSQGQLSMPEAIECGKTWLEDFLMPHLGAEEYIPREYKISCYLMALQEDEEENVGKDMFSYWMMTYDAQNVDVQLLLNAVTGQVLDASINCYFPIEYLEDGGLVNLLGDYADSFGMEGEYVVACTDTEAAEGGVLMFQDIGDTGVFAAIRADNIIVSWGGAGPNEYQEVLHIRLYLNHSIM